MARLSYASIGLSSAEALVFSEVATHSENNNGVIVISDLYRTNENKAGRVSAIYASRVIKRLISLGLLESYKYAHYRLTKKGSELHASQT